MSIGVGKVIIFSPISQVVYRELTPTDGAAQGAQR